MEFKINYSENSLKLSGQLTENNIQLFKLVTYKYLTKCDKLTLDMNNVTCVDKLGVKSILALYKYSLRHHKDILFYGNGARDIIEELHHKNIA